MLPVHPNEISFEEGVFLVKLARKAIEKIVIEGETLKPPPEAPEKFKRPGMTFTTIETYLGEKLSSLRGCIGFLAPIYSLLESTIYSAIEAATGDPRFPPVTPQELDKILVEVTVLSVPTPLMVSDRKLLPRLITIGRHGLVVEKGFYKGTLLPVVPVEYCWEREEFLSETCLKAGLRPDCWLNPSTKVYYYEGRVFREKTPKGDIYERDLSQEYVTECLKR
uniref:Protein ENP55_04620 n=1 Tax=Thermosphaera aggregans TaxID=54254 RepID=A0A7C2FR44_9CREN